MLENPVSEKRLRKALENEEFVLHYQPKYKNDGRTLAGLEALMRWQGPALRLVPPTQFVPTLEKTGLIVPVGAWALRRAALDHRLWQAAGLAPPRVAVNVSTLQLQQRDFAQVVQQAMPAGIPRPSLELEI